MFAGDQVIPSHTYLGIYAGEYLTNEVGEERGKSVFVLLFAIYIKFLAGNTTSSGGRICSKWTPII